MLEAVSIYSAELIQAEDCKYGDSVNNGLICPLCSEAVFLAKGELQQAHFRHYKNAGGTCELRSMFATLPQSDRKHFTSEAKGQRLKLFEKRFWDVFKYNKYIPPKMIEKAEQTLPDGGFPEFCKQTKLWWLKPDSIYQAGKVWEKIDEKSLAKSLELHRLDVNIFYPLLESDVPIQRLRSPLNRLIRSEVWRWLPTSSESLRKVLALAVWDAAEISRLQGQQITIAGVPAIVNVNFGATEIVNMVCSSIYCTDWEQSIASVPKSKGFGK